MNKKLAVLLLTVAFSLGMAKLGLAATYTIDAAHSSAAFEVKHLTVSTVHGNFGAFEGTIEYDPANLAGFKADATIKVDSINTANADRDKHLKTPDFFDAEKFPEITFQSTKLENGILFGSLTIKGVTKTVTIPVNVTGPVNNPFGGTAIGISGKTTINRQDFGVTWNKDLDNGGVMVSNEVDIIVDIEAHAK